MGTTGNIYTTDTIVHAFLASDQSYIGKRRLGDMRITVGEFPLTSLGEGKVIQFPVNGIMRDLQVAKIHSIEGSIFLFLGYAKAVPAIRS